MDGPASVPPRAPDAERLYDEFLDACLAGRAESPAAFLARHGVVDPDLLARLQAFQGLRTAGAVAGGAPPGLPHTRLGPYDLIERIAAGGMGTVYRARHRELDRDVALKVVRLEGPDLETLAQRFAREAQVVARLRHPAIVGVHDAGQDEGVLWLAMEWVPGRPLGEVLREGSPDTDRVLGWGVALADALAHAHAAGIVHRDVKPANVLITDEDRPVLVDFGIAHVVQADVTRLTQTFAGSPCYAAPEQVMEGGPDIDARTDIYGLGATLYEALCGRPPFGPGPVSVVLRLLVTEEPEPVSRLRPDLPRAVGDVLRRALEKRPAARYPDMPAFAADLQALRHHRAVAARPPSPWSRTTRWARRHPARAGVLATVLLVAGIALCVGLWRAHRAAVERRAEAAELVRRGLERIAVVRAARLARRGNDNDLARRQDALESQYVSEEEERACHALAARLAGERREEERLFHEVLEALADAERLDPEVQGTAEVRARLYLERLEDAEMQHDAAACTFYEERVAEHDPDGRVLAGLRAMGHLDLVTDPPGAAVHAWRVVSAADLDPGLGPRLVPIPLDGPPLLKPGAWALRVVEPAGALQVGDLVLETAGVPVGRHLFVLSDAGALHRGDRLLRLAGREIATRADLQELDEEGLAEIEVRHADGTQETVRADAGQLRLGDAADLVATGGVPGRVLVDGAIREALLPAGLRTRITAAPRALTRSTLLGTTPFHERPLAPGRYVLLLRADAREDLVLPVDIAPSGRQRADVRLLPQGSTPAGFVRVVGASGPDDWFWIMEREVTCEEYMAFLEDPATRAEIQAADRPIRFPRSGADAHAGGAWRDPATGGWRLPPGFAPDFPVLGVSFEDAQAHARWRSAREGRPYRLPTRAQWLMAGEGALAHRAYAFGDVFSPRWAKTCFARPRAFIEATMAYPTDESPLGVYDMTGSAAEWLDAWYDEPRKLRWLGGQGWGQAKAETFKLWSGFGLEATVAYYETGFRLVLLPEAPP